MFLPVQCSLEGRCNLRWGEESLKTMCTYQWLVVHANVSLLEIGNACGKKKLTQLVAWGGLYSHMSHISVSPGFLQISLSFVSLGVCVPHLAMV